MGPFASGPSFKAGGTIAPCRIVKLSTSAEGKVLQGTANAYGCIGISGEGQNTPPGLTGSDAAVNASSGDMMHDMRTVGQEALLELGSGGATLGGKLESDSVGMGILASGTGQHNLIGYALQAGSAGEKIRVWIMPHQITL